MLVEILKIKTRNLKSVVVYDSGSTFLDTDCYVIKSTSNKGEELVRFGNETQMLSILVGYKFSVTPDTKEAYEAFMKENYYR